MNSLSSDMLTFKNITENELPGSNSLSSDMLTFLPDMSSLSHDSSIGLLEFLGFPLGSLWEHFSDIWVSIGGPLEPFGYPWGVYWIPLGTLWIPLDTLWTPLGSLWRSSAPLGHYFGDFGIMLGPSDCKKGPKVYPQSIDISFLLQNVKIKKW